MTKTIASVGAIVVTAALIGALVLGHAAAQHPRALVNQAASAAVIDSPTPSPVDTPATPVPVPSSAPIKAPPPAPPSQPAATVQNPLPSPSPTPASSPSPVPSPSPVQIQPSPSPTPPPPPPPPCSWSVTVQTQATAGTWSDLGTWTGSTSTSTSPLFIAGVYGWISYTYSFTDSCIGHASLRSQYAQDGQLIYTDAITSTAVSTRQANTPPNSEIDFVVTIQ